MNAHKIIWGNLTGRRDRERPKPTGTNMTVTRDSLTFDGDYLFDAATGLRTIAQSLTGMPETVDPGFLSFVQNAFAASPIVFACIWNRMALFRQGRFQWRQIEGDRPGRVFGDQSLGLLERPWPKGSAGQLLSLAEISASCSGNFMAAKRGGGLRIMRPDWTELVIGNLDDEDADANALDSVLVAYLYHEGGRMGGDPILLRPDEVLHYMPIPDPILRWRGISWLTPVIEEMLADKSMTRHRRKFMDAGASPNFIVKLDTEDMAEFQKWVDEYRKGREGAGVDVNPYRALFLAAVADVVPVGTNLRELDFTATQSGGEVRIAAAAGVHPTVAAFTAGLQGSALNAGNYEAAFRQFGHATIRPLWGAFAEAAQDIMVVPKTSTGVVELWVSDRDIPAMQQDAKTRADIANTQAGSISTLWNAGFDPDAAVVAVTTGDLSTLVGGHTGLPPVQTRPADGTKTTSQNGDGDPKKVPAPA